jgi:DNA polymerase III epsilon subunit-like protein
VLLKFSDLLSRVDYLVVHNLSFDEKILGAELIRMGLPI